MSASMQDVRSRFDLWFKELDPICHTANPWGFLCLSALIDYLSRLATNVERPGRKEFVTFITDYFPDQYGNFRYKNGKTDLPHQMYSILRSGLVHSFSLVPDERTKKGGGRARSIVLIHAQEATRQGLDHLQNYSGPQGNLDAALFVAQDFLNDTRIAADNLLTKATPGSVVENNILSWFSKYPPITGHP
jgi:hypothetical protein